jgi:hypothetical protein
MKTTANAMSKAGCSAADIADYLTSRGCIGTLTDDRLKYHIKDVRKDAEDFTAIPKANETDAEALIRLLQEKNADTFICTRMFPKTRAHRPWKW